MFQNTACGFSEHHRRTNRSANCEPQQFDFQSIEAFIKHWFIRGTQSIALLRWEFQTQFHRKLVSDFGPRGLGLCHPLFAVHVRQPGNLSAQSERRLPVTHKEECEFPQSHFRSPSKSLETVTVHRRLVSSANSAIPKGLLRKLQCSGKSFVECELRNQEASHSVDNGSVGLSNNFGKNGNHRNCTQNVLLHLSILWRG